MFKSYSTSYSYSSDGKKEISEYNTSIKDNKNDYSLGVKKNLNLENNEKKEMFYKSKSDPNESRRIYGKSNNSSQWELQNIKNNILEVNYSQDYEKYSRYFDKLNQKSLINENNNQILNYPNTNYDSDPKNNNNKLELPDYHLIHPINNTTNILNARDLSLKKYKRRPIVGDLELPEIESYFKDDFFNF
jgi:hypothetical protein